MVLTLQPCDWIEHDESGKYVVDVYGRTEETATMVRIEGFKPYLYVLPGSITVAQLKKDLAVEKVNSVIVTEKTKFDAYAGFNNFSSTKVWKVEVESLSSWRTTGKVCKKLFPRVYESNIPPFLRLFHEREIGPASPIVFQPSSKMSNGWRTNVRDVAGDPSKNIPLKIAAYDIECTSKTGQFPIAIKDWSYVIEHLVDDLQHDTDSSISDVILKRLVNEGMIVPASWKEKVLVPFLQKHEGLIDKEDWETLGKKIESIVNVQIGDPIIQIGVTVRWTTDMLTNVKRRVFVWGSVSGSPEFVACETESDVIGAFVEFLQEENVDVLCGYNTFGFDDKYVHDRASVNGMGKLQFGRAAAWGELLEHKVFELASGKYNVNYLKMPGRLSIDLLLNMRREHNLDSYTLDNVASTFLRDKVVRVEGSTIHTKTTRGLTVGNFVKFDVVGNTINSYQEGKKFLVKSISPKSFVIDSSDLFGDLSADDRAHLEWSFTKDDIHPADIFRLHEGSASDRGIVAKYCIQDCDLVLTLMAKLDTMVNARGMADVCFVPFQYLFLRGQGIKIFSRVAYEASKRDQIIVVQESYDGDTAYEGAIVISPKIGMYLETPVAVLDFNSLYPSSMIGENLSPDTLICMKTYNADGKLVEVEGMKDVKGIDYNEVSYDLKNGDEIIGKCVCLYVKPIDGNEISTGLIPRSLEIMLKKRKEARKKMEDPTVDDAQKSVYNGLQLAYKVVANSIYGQMGSKTSPIRKICVAACTTAVGRRQLLFAKSTVENDFGATVVYGDSVASYTPVMVRIHGNINILRIDQLDAYGQGWMPYGDKELCELNGVESWTEKGWTPVKNIIRHRLVDGKKMMRVLTHSGVVDVTDDHSLVRANGEAASSNDLVVGDKLLHHSYPEISSETFEISVDEARIAGFFFGDGSCGCYECPSGDKSSWALNNADTKLLEFYKELCERAYPQLRWKINDTIESSGVYKLVPSGNVKPFIVAYRASMYTEFKEKRVPMSVLNGSLEVRQAFWDGLYDADGDKNGINVRIDQKNQLSAAHIMYLGASLGYKVSVTDRCSKEHIYRMTCTKSCQRKDPDAIKRIREIIIYTGFVYDLTTENHHFQAGVGKMIVHNTDSIFVKFPGKNLEESIKLGQESAKLITSRCRHKAFVIGYEKTFYPFILFCRKRYVGMKYEEDPTKCYRASMGIVLKRRDNAPIVKDVFGGALDILLKEKNVKIAAEFVKSMLVRVVKGDFPIEKFAITKQLRDDYKDPTRIAHRVLADRMTARDPGNAPNVGDRLKFVYIQTTDKKLQGDKIEHIDYVREKKLPIDTLHYITNQIQNPVAQLFALCIDDMEGYKEPRPTYSELYDQYFEKLNDSEEATLKVLAHKEKHLEKLMFSDAPYLSNVIRASRRGPLDAFFKRV